MDAADLRTLENSFGAATSAWASGDFNRDGQVDSLDYLDLKRNFGRAVPTPPPATLPATAVGGAGDSTARIAASQRLDLLQTLPPLRVALGAARLGTVGRLLLFAAGF